MFHPYFNARVRRANALRVDGSGNIKHAPHDRAVCYDTPRFAFLWSAKLNEDKMPDPNGKRHVLLKMEG